MNETKKKKKKYLHYLSKLCTKPKHQNEITQN